MLRSLSIRISDDMRRKLRFLAQYYGQSANSHIVFLIRQDIDLFEKQHGEIRFEVQDDGK